MNETYQLSQGKHAHTQSHTTHTQTYTHKDRHTHTHTLTHIKTHTLKAASNIRQADCKTYYTNLKTSQKNS